MKKQLLFVLFYILCSNYSHAQTFQWAKAGSSNGANKMVGIKSGNIYVGGQFAAKYDSLGNFIWQQNIIAYGVKEIVVDTIGNVYATGVFGGTLTIDTITLTAEYNNMYLAKFNSAENVQWVKQSHSNAFSGTDALTIDKQGNPIIIGRFSDSLILDSFVFDAPLTSQIFLAKYSASGACLWAKHLISASFDGGANGPEIKSDKLGNTYISGHFNNYASFDSTQIYGNGGQYDQDIFLTKIDPSGKFVWLKALGGNSEEISGAMDVDSLGNSYISGYFSSAPAYFGSYAFSTGSYNYFTAKYDTDGNCLWTKYGNANTICAANDGYYTNAPGLITKYDSLGNLEWTKTVAGAVNNAMVAVNTDVYLTGSYNGSVNFDTCALSSTSNQMYIAKLSDPNPPIITTIKEKESNTGFSVYPNPANSVITISISTTKPKENFSLKVNNSLGSTVYSETIKEVSGSTTKQVDLIFLPRGIYFIELQQQGSLNNPRLPAKEVRKIVLQ